MYGESFQKISGDLSDAHDSVRVALDCGLQSYSHLLSSPVSFCYRINSNHYQQHDYREDCQRSDEMLPHSERFADREMQDHSVEHAGEARSHRVIHAAVVERHEALLPVDGIFGYDGQHFLSSRIDSEIDSDGTDRR